MKKFCLLFVGGEGPTHKNLNTVLSDFLAVDDAECYRESFFVVACDGGAKLALDCGYKVDLLVGDLDSIDEGTLAHLKREKTEIVQYSTDKDDTDSQIGLLYAKKKALPVILVGGGGGRLDHLLSLWEDMKSPYAPALWVNASDLIYLFHVERKTDPLSLAFEITPDIRISFFPLKSIFCDGTTSYLPLSTKGLKWDFDSLPANNHFSSQSNRCETGHFSIQLKEGAVAIISAVDSRLKQSKIGFMD